MALREVLIAECPPERLRQFLPPARGEQLERAVDEAQGLLRGRTVWSVNSTPRGGGVAEMLQSLLPYVRGAGIDARWIVIEGSEPFFRLTKRLHNMLHGFPGDGRGLSRSDQRLYAGTCAANARGLADLVADGDLVLLHDPQTAGMAEPLRARGARVVWRCHVGADEVTPPVCAARSFLIPFVHHAEAAVFSRAAHRWEGLEGLLVEVIAPSIDAFSPKNQPLAPDVACSILEDAGVQAGASPAAPAFVRHDGSAGRVVRQADLHGSASLEAGVPVIAQVSRWDALKDAAGVMTAFCDRIAPAGDAHLVLAGPAGAAVSDDPEAAAVLRHAIGTRERCARRVRGRIHLLSLPMEDGEENAAIVNALQRRASVVVQKSLAEGFGLTVAEAMWKARPVVASRVGGIRDQIVDGRSGRLVAPTDLDGFADAATSLLADPSRAWLMGAAARERVRDHFLAARHLEQYVDLFARLLGSVLADVSHDRA